MAVGSLRLDLLDSKVVEKIIINAATFFNFFQRGIRMWSAPSMKSFSLILIYLDVKISHAIDAPLLFFS